MEKYGSDRQVMGDNRGHAHCMLDTKCYEYTLGMCNNYCFTTATTVAKYSLVLRLYVHCLVCYKYFYSMMLDSKLLLLDSKLLLLQLQELKLSRILLNQ